MDIYWRHDKLGRLTVEYDTDRDGYYELRLQDEEGDFIFEDLETTRKVRDSPALDVVKDGSRDLLGRGDLDVPSELN